LIVKDIAQTIFRRVKPTKKTSSANINTVAHKEKTEVFLGFFYNLCALLGKKAVQLSIYTDPERHNTLRQRQIDRQTTASFQ